MTGTTTAAVFVLLTLALAVHGDNYCLNSTHYNMTFTLATSIQISTFTNCTKATHVNASHNGITELSNETFYYVWTIQVLDLSFNELTEIKPGTFFNLRKLTHLYITNNRLKTLPLDFFSAKLSLITVDLSFNNINDLPLPVFKQYMPSIKRVILHHNELESFEPWGIAYEKEFNVVVKYIDVRYNRITEYTNHYNFTYETRTLYAESVTDLRFNNLSHLYTDYLRQYKDHGFEDAKIPMIMAQLGTDIRNNSLWCDCHMYQLTHSFHNSYFLFAKEDMLEMECFYPPELRGKQILYDVRLSELVCNVTQECPPGCLCQERPDDKVINVDCVGSNLTSIPHSLPYNPDYSAYQLVLTNNRITQLEDVDYADEIALLQASNNSISYINDKLITKMAEKDDSKLLLQNNQLTRVPETMKNIKYQNVDLEGNALVCDCEMLWMKQWINLAPKYVVKTLSCTYEGKVYKIVDLDEDILKCSDVGNILLVVFLSIGLLIVICLMITAKRCPYATKVLIFKIFRIHPADRYVVDTVPDKEFDAYIAYDEDDTYVRQWVERVLSKQLEEKKPHYKLFIGVRDKAVGVEAESRVEAMENSRRLVIILSQKFSDKRWCDYDACQAETLEHNEGRVIFIIYDEGGEELARTEPWLSKIKDRKVFRLHERMFWSKMRYELPRKPVRSSKTKQRQLQQDNQQGMKEIVVDI